MNIMFSERGIRHLRGFIPKLILNTSELVIISLVLLEQGISKQDIIAVRLLPSHPDRLPFNHLAC